MTSRRTRALALAAVLLAGGRTLGQAPPVAAPPAQASSPAIDLSGYWTPALHEDSTERGAGPEMADYSGLPLNEAGRLFALSYDPSRLTLRHHQCDGYVAPYQMRALGNSRAWEERDPHTHQLVAIHWFSQTFEGKRTIWMDGRAASARLGTSFVDGILDRPFRRHRAGGAYHAPETGLVHAERGSRKRPGDPAGIFRPARRSSDAHGRRDRSGVPRGATGPDHRFRTSAGRPSELAVSLRRRRAGARTGHRTTFRAICSARIRASRSIARNIRTP